MVFGVYAGIVIFSESLHSHADMLRSLILCFEPSVISSQKIIRIVREMEDYCNVSCVWLTGRCYATPRENIYNWMIIHDRSSVCAVRVRVSACVGDGV